MPGLAWTEVALGATSKLRILRLLTRSPDRIFTEAAIARAVRMSPNTVNVALRDLKAAGLVLIHGTGRGERVQFHSGAIFGDPLRKLFKSEEDLAGALIEKMSAAVPQDTACVLFGSVARGEATPMSDIDILIVAPSHDAAADADVHVRRAGRAIYKGRFNMLHYTPSELRRAWDSPLLRAIRAHGITFSPKTMEDLI